MSFMLTLEESRLAEQIIPILDDFEADIKKAEPLFKLEGEKLEHIARSLPYHQQLYAQRASEAKHLVKWLDNHLSKIEARMLKNMAAGHQRAFGVREQGQLIAGEREVVEHKQLIIEVSLIQGKLDEIVEGFRQMGWVLGHITKLRVAELGEVVL